MCPFVPFLIADGNCILGTVLSVSGASISTLSYVIFEDQADGELSHHLDLEKADEEGKKMASAPHESSEERASQTHENYHLRKSLAWDTAFFTSDG